jgi:hypothetical protein
MLDIFGALGLISTAVQQNKDPQLFEDAGRLYGVYQKLAAKELTVRSIPLGELKELIQTVARVSAVASKLVEDPKQLEALSDLLSSL